MIYFFFIVKNSPKNDRNFDKSLNQFFGVTESEESKFNRNLAKFYGATPTYTPINK